MTLYTSKVIAQWLCLTERRVRQLRDEGVIVEARPGLYELQPTVARYIKYLGGAGKESLNTMSLQARELAGSFFPDCRRKEYNRLWGSKKAKAAGNTAGDNGSAGAVCGDAETAPGVDTIPMG